MWKPDSLQLDTLQQSKYTALKHDLHFSAQVCERLLLCAHFCISRLLFQKCCYENRHKYRIIHLYNNPDKQLLLCKLINSSSVFIYFVRVNLAQIPGTLSIRWEFSLNANVSERFRMCSYVLVLMLHLTYLGSRNSALGIT